jgi:hypothetical protein
VNVQTFVPTVGKPPSGSADEPPFTPVVVCVNAGAGVTPPVSEFAPSASVELLPETEPESVTATPAGSGPPVANTSTEDGTTAAIAACTWAAVAL